MSFKSLKVAIFFNNKKCFYTTGIYCLKALKDICKVFHFLPQHQNRIHKFYDLYLYIDDDSDYVLNNNLKPSAFWAIDTHIKYSIKLEQAQKFDYVFTAQKNASLKFTQEGIKNVFWLPLGCDPDIHKKFRYKKIFDICFIGNLEIGDRLKYINLIRKNFGRNFIKKGVYFRKMAKIYSQSKIIFNKSVNKDINMRVFEALCCGSMLLTDNIINNGMEELFEEGKHLLSYFNEDDFLEKACYYLRNDKEREIIAYNGMRLVQEKHTYKIRMSKLLYTIFG